MGFDREDGASRLIRIEVRTRSARPGVERVGAEAFRVKVASPPVKGAANREVIKLMAAFLDLPPSSLEIIKGRTSSRKVIAVHRAPG